MPNYGPLDRTRSQGRRCGHSCTCCGPRRRCNNIFRKIAARVSQRAPSRLRFSDYVRIGASSRAKEPARLGRTLMATDRWDTASIEEKLELLRRDITDIA